MILVAGLAAIVVPQQLPLRQDVEIPARIDKVKEGARGNRPMVDGEVAAQAN